jgi:NDP-sugar pyrophosphorylase family protein
MDTVIIQAGGMGTRLLPITATIPKPLVSINGIPALEHQIIFFKKYGINNVTIIVNYLKDSIKNYFKGGDIWGVEIKYIEEDKKLGTAGSLVQNCHSLPDQFIVVYCDYFLNFNLNKFIDFHNSKGNSLATVIAQKNSWPHEADHLEYDNQNRITKLIHRPFGAGQKIKNCASTGLYICKKDLFKYFTPNKEDQFFEKDLIPNAVSANQSIYAYLTDEYIADMGSHSHREKVENDIKSGNATHLNVEDFPDYAYT